MDKTVEPQPLEAPEHTFAIGCSPSGTQTSRNTGLRRASLFIHCPHFYVGYGVVFLHLLHYSRQFFFPLLLFHEVSFCMLAPAGSAVCTSCLVDTPTPEKGDTRQPNNSLIQSATLRPFHSPPSGASPCSAYHSWACCTSFSSGSLPKF